MMKNIFTLIFLVLTLNFTVAQTNRTTEIRIVKDTEYVDEAPNVLPKYPGGVNELMSFLGQNLIYPQKAIEDNIQGKVVVKFVVDKKGNAANPEIINSIHPLLDAEALRVVSLLTGFTPGQKNGHSVNTWYTLPINFKFQDDVPEIEEFDAVAIDSIGYQEMMDLGLSAQKENNLAHATAYFKEAFHINPYSIDPIERIVKMNDANGKSELNYETYEFGVDQLSRWNQMNGTGNSSVFPMNWLAERMNIINPDDLYPQFALLWTYLQLPSQTYQEKANSLLDKLIPLSEKQELWDQYGHLMSLKSFFLIDENAVTTLYEPNVDKLSKSPQGVGALVLLSQVYKANGDTLKADKYMKMAEVADPNRVELQKWLERFSE